eukprot:225969-Pelagomonas_calceolata.AAC.3
MVILVEETRGSLRPCVSFPLLYVRVLLPMAGLFDAEKELARLNKQRTKLQKDYDGVTARLSNTKFLEKASQVGACSSGSGHVCTSAF